MHIAKVFLAALGARWTSSVHAQQFLGPKQSYSAMGLTDECTNVLNTELEHCDSYLFDRTDRSINNVVGVLPHEELDQMCKPECREELTSLRKKIIETCTSPQDVMRDSGLEFPAQFFADKFAYTYDINCMKQESTGRFCDQVRKDWREGEITYNQCDECYLGQLAASISSPIGFSDEQVARFKKIKTECKDTKYNPTIAESYARPAASVEARAKAKAASVNGKEKKCARWYNIREGDTCKSISLSQNSSTVNLIQNNGMNINCQVMPDVGTKLCLSEPCNTHTILPGEDCASIAERYNITQAQFRSMNTMVDSKCSNIARWEGYVACIGPVSIIPKTPLPSFTSELKSSPQPYTPLKPLAPGSSSKCIVFVNGRALTDPDWVDSWGSFGKAMMSPEIIKRHNRCGHVADANQMSIDQFMKLNPTLAKLRNSGEKCFLEEHYSYCLAEKGGPKFEYPSESGRLHALRWG